MTSERKIVGLKTDYGSLDLRMEDRAAFIEDALRVLREIGEVLKGEGDIVEFTSLHYRARRLGYAGDIVGNYFEPHRRFAVTLVFSHTEDEIKTRPDGVAGYALYRRTKGNSVVPKWRPEDRRALYGTYPDALIQLVRTMLADHPENPDRKQVATAS